MGLNRFGVFQSRDVILTAYQIVLTEKPPDT